MELFIFKTGKYPQGEWPLERLQRMAAAYDPENYIESPVIIGHDDSFFTFSIEQQFAHGWVKSLRLDSKGKLFAEIPRFSKEAANAIIEEKLKYISVEIFEFDKVEEKNPPYLKAVALLGKDIPQIATTKIPAFFKRKKIKFFVKENKKNHTITFTRKLTTREIKGFEQAASQAAENITGEEQEDMAKIEELQQQLELQKQQTAQFQQENSALKQENTLLKNNTAAAGAKQFYQGFTADLQLPPALFQKAVEIDQACDPPLQVKFREFVGNFVKINGVAADTDGGGAGQAGKDQGGGGSLVQQVRQFQQEKNLATFGEAMQQLAKLRPELFQEGGI